LLFEKQITSKKEFEERINRINLEIEALDSVIFNQTTFADIAKYVAPPNI
jgi:tRNA threonylcarbamoyladenosine modification (KEOPS) complex  Pcc1 subunit